MVAFLVARGGVQDLRDFVDSLPGVFDDSMQEAAELLVEFIRDEIGDRFRPGSGDLADSFEAEVRQEGDEVFGFAFSDLVYADIQDRGGTITPTTRQNLAVPIGDKVPRGKWPKDFARGELTLIPRKGKDSLLARVSKSGGIDPLFVLKKSVTLTGRQYLAAASEKAEPAIEELLDRDIQFAIDRDL